jgi:hypothetical protein
LSREISPNFWKKIALFVNFYYNKIIVILEKRRRYNGKSRFGKNRHYGEQKWIWRIADSENFKTGGSSPFKTSL